MYQISLEDKEGLEKYLLSRHAVSHGEELSSLEIAGHGNMNVVLRVKTNERSFILKQSRPFVQKFPSVLAPLARIEVENEFYRQTEEAKTWLAKKPQIFWFDEQNHVLCMEDLGVSSDFTNIYRKEVDVTKAEIAELAKTISELHCIPPNGSGIKNGEMRQLNSMHIFQLPLQAENGFDLNSVIPGLQEKTEKFRGNARLQTCANNLGQIYLNGEGEKLLHGDFYPGSWLRTKDGIKIIDPEFCFHGKPEFELGVMIAHLKLAQQTSSLMKDLFVYYHFDSRFDGSLFTKFAGMEMIRRLIGLAQLPLDLTLKERLDMLDEAYELVIHG